MYVCNQNSIGVSPPEFRFGINDLKLWAFLLIETYITWKQKRIEERLDWSSAGLNSTVGAGDATASLSKIFWAKLIKFGRNLSKIKEKFGQKWPDLSKVEVKFTRFRQIWLDSGKIKILHPQKHSITYGWLRRKRLPASRYSPSKNIFFKTQIHFSSKFPVLVSARTCEKEQATRRMDGFIFAKSFDNLSTEIFALFAKISLPTYLPRNTSLYSLRNTKYYRNTLGKFAEKNQKSLFSNTFSYS